MININKLIAVAALTASLSASPAVLAQEAVLTDAEIAAACIETPDICESLVAELLAALQAQGFTGTALDDRIRTLTVAIAESASAAELSGTAALNIATALRLAATTATDPALQTTVLQIAQATEDGEDFETAALGDEPSPS